MVMMIRSFFLKLCLLEFQKPTMMAELSVPESGNDRLLSQIFYLHPHTPFHCFLPTMPAILDLVGKAFLVLTFAVPQSVKAFG